MRYVVLFLYVVRNDLLKDLSDQSLINSYERVLVLDEVYKGNLLTFWKPEFIDVAVDLNLIKNIRSLREFEQKGDDFIIKLADPIKVEENVIAVPEDTLFLMISKKFKFLTKRNFNLAATKLKAVRCERSGVIHQFIFELGEKKYTLSDDMYRIFDQYGNVYQSIKIEITVEGFYQRFKEIQDNITELLEIFDPILNSNNAIKKIKTAIEENKDILLYLKEEKIKLSDKFEFDKIDKSASIFKEWHSKLLELLKFRQEITNIEKDILDIKNNYSGKNKKYSYLEFIQKVSFNEDDIVNKIQDSLVQLREKVIHINKEVSKLTKKDIKLLNLDFEKFTLTSSES